MDKTYQLNGINFVWDMNKAQINSNNHGVTFDQAAEAFFDPFLRIVDASPEEETRDAVIGGDWYGCALELTFCCALLYRS